MNSFLFQAFVYLLAAVVSVLIAKKAGLGSVLGYLMAGIVIGPALHLVATRHRTCSISPSLASS